MTLNAVLEFLHGHKQLKDLHINSHQVEPNDVFIALPGRRVDGRNYIRDAQTRGAGAILYEAKNFVPPKTKCPAMGIENLEKLVAQIADQFYQSPSSKLKIIGVTGTNGKTSITHYIAQLLSLHGHSCGVMGTLGNGVFPNLASSDLTTSDCCTIQRQLASCAKQGAQFVAMEVSSIGLDQDRLLHTHVDTAIFTNLSQDHLDYHKNMQNYFAAKCKLFTTFNLKNAVINIDDAYGQQLLAMIPKHVNTITYSIHNTCADIYLQAREIMSPWGTGPFETRLMGQFNQSNLLAAIAACALQGISMPNLLRSAPKLQPATGRMELISKNLTQSPKVVVDYAHTPDALVKALQTLRQYKPRKLFCVFGCGGDRDRLKRPLMMQAVLDNSDEIVLTQDNSRTEDPEQIIQDMLSGASVGSNISIELDRARAIAQTIKRATCEDIVLIAGKGHENYQIIGTTKFPFSDQLVGIEALGES